MLWLLLVAAIAADHLTTRHALRRYGLKLEGNPVIRSVWRRWGSAGMLLVQCAILFPILWVMQTRAPDYAFLIPLIPFVAAANNVRVIAVMRRRKAAARLRAENRSGSGAGTMEG